MIELTRQFPPQAAQWRNENTEGLRQSGIISSEEHWDWVRKMQDDPTSIYFGVVDDGKFVGYVGLTSLDQNKTRNHRTAEYSVLIDPSKTGKGYGTESVKKLLDYAFNVLDLEVVYGEILATNTPGLRLAEKVGFKEEGTLRSRYYKNGKRVDSKMVSILKSEWN